jgi:N-acetylmuramoyl-L-alanine amidase
MILALALALQLGPGPTTLTVRTPAGEATIPLVVTRVGPAVRPEALIAVLDTEVTSAAPGRFIVRMAGVAIEIGDGVPFARSGARVYPLAAAPFVAGDRLHLPLQLLADVLPRLAPEVRWDSRTATLHAPAASHARVASRAAETAAASAAGGVDRRSPAPSSGNVARGASRRRAPRRQRVVVVDAGHGGPDAGMSGPIGARPKIHEKDVTLAVARELRQALATRGVRVVMTRDRDTLIALSDRGHIANTAGGDLFVSVHVNAANLRWRNPQGARGFETYFLAEAKTEDERRLEQMENDAVRFETGAHAPKNDPLRQILNDMAQNEHLRESQLLADTIQQAMARVHPGPNRGVKQAGFRVLVTAFMPAVLVEIGFGTNAAEARYMTDPRRQGDLADALADAIVGYLERYERRVGGSAP